MPPFLRRERMHLSPARPAIEQQIAAGRIDLGQLKALIALQQGELIWTALARAARSRRVAPYATGCRVSQYGRMTDFRHRPEIGQFR